MNIWLCPVKAGSWRIIKRFKVFGTPGFISKMKDQVKPDDLLIFHVFKPVNGIVAVGRVVSDVYEDHTDIWGRDRYPLRVRIEIVPGLQRDEIKPIPLSTLVSNYSDSELLIEPYLKDVWLAAISTKQYENIKKAFARDN